ncbi:MAG: protein kinase [Rhodopirellula sp. JB055]|uniref:protein kinase domain-containing protein n=1 Tax=Rhodopirellula sp. JB055 TaxID=3342846 RepID=UPI00370AF16A
MSIPTPEEFIQRAIAVGIADRRSIDRALAELGSEERRLSEVIELLQRHGILTTLQCEKLSRGDKGGYYYGEYKVQYLIGAGTFARVYRAQKGDEVFAVKVLRKRFRDEPKEMEQFLREGRMGLKLKHPNIVRILDVVPDVRNPFLVMEFVEGQTLRELVRIRKQHPVEISLKLTMEIPAGLAHAA